MTRRRGGGVRWVLALAVGCVLVGVLSTAGSASAASRLWTVANHSVGWNYSPLDMKLMSVKPYEDNRMEFEGTPEDGSVIGPYGYQHFELTYGANVQAVLTYQFKKPDEKPVEAQFWIRNSLGFASSACRLKWVSDDGKQHEGAWGGGESYRSAGRPQIITCYAGGSDRDVGLEYGMDPEQGGPGTFRDWPAPCRCDPQGNE